MPFDIYLKNISMSTKAFIKLLTQLLPLARLSSPFTLFISTVQLEIGRFNKLISKLILS